MQTYPSISSNVVAPALGRAGWNAAQLDIFYCKCKFAGVQWESAGVTPILLNTMQPRQ